MGPLPEPNMAFPTGTAVVLLRFKSAFTYIAFHTYQIFITLWGVGIIAN